MADKEWNKETIAELVCRARLAGFPGSVLMPLVKSGESSIVALFLSLIAGKSGEDLIRADGIKDLCHVELEYPFPRGRADIVVFHEDGSATIIEAKDGANGIRHVVSGLGQLASYAYQLGASKGAPREIRKALMWSSVGSGDGDIHVESVCRANGVIPIMMASVKKSHAATCEWLERELCRT